MVVENEVPRRHSAADISLEQLRKVFGSGSGSDAVVALDDVSLDVGDGQLVVLVGPSGCGKTTLLRSVAGLEKPTSGRITIGDRLVFSPPDHTDVPPDQRNVGMVFQSYALWPHLTIADNVAYPLKRHRVPRKQIRPRVLSSLEAVDCAQLATRYPHELSGGQQQRVALARAMVASPAVLLFDEPLSNLDANLRERMRTEIKLAQRRIGCTALYVTHDQREAMAIADRLVVMEDGRVLQQGSPEEVYARPASRFVADFLGGANLIPVARRAGDGQVETALGTIHVVDDAGRGTLGPDDHYVAVRLEALSISNGSTPTGCNEVEAVLSTTEFLGDHRLGVFEASGHVLRAKLPVGVHVEVGERYRLAFPVTSSVLVTDRST